MLELSLSQDNKKGFSNPNDEKKVVKSFLQRVSPQQGKSRRLATEYGNRVQPRANGRLGFSARRKNRSAFIKKTTAPSGITVSVRRANTSNKSKIHLEKHARRGVGCHICGTKMTLQKLEASVMHFTATKLPILDKS